MKFLSYLSEEWVTSVKDFKLRIGYSTCLKHARKGDRYKGFIFKNLGRKLDNHVNKI